LSDRRNFLSRGVILIGAGVALLHLEVEGGDLGRLAASALAEADRRLQHQGDFVALGLDAVEAVGDLGGLRERALDRRAEVLNHPLDVFAAGRVGFFHRFHPKELCGGASPRVKPSAGHVERGGARSAATCEGGFRGGPRMPIENAA
jgi:hypothetical protein